MLCFAALQLLCRVMFYVSVQLLFFLSHFYAISLLTLLCSSNYALCDAGLLGGGSGVCMVRVDIERSGTPRSMLLFLGHRLRLIWHAVTEQTARWIHNGVCT